MDNVTTALANDVKQALSPQRFQHVEGVVSTAVVLANAAHVPVEQAMQAAWLHDLAREWPRDRLLQVAETINIPSGFAAMPTLLHGPIAAHLGRATYGLTDEAILDAVRFHTTGRPQMTALDLVLFVADAIEPNRQYPGVDEIREAAQQSLAGAAQLSIDHTIRFLLEAGKPLFPLTILTRNWLLTARTISCTTTAIEKEACACRSTR